MSRGGSRTDAAFTVEKVASLTDDDMQALCEATTASILDGGGFGWIQPPGRAVLERYFGGVLLVPERILFVGRLAGTIVGAAQLLRPAKNMESQAMSASLAHAFVAPYARGHGIARALTERVEESARAYGYQVLNLDVRETQLAAIRLYDSLGYTRWGTHPAYARVDGRTVAGHFYLKRLQSGDKAVRAE